MMRPESSGASPPPSHHHDREPLLRRHRRQSGPTTLFSSRFLLICAVLFMAGSFYRFTSHTESGPKAPPASQEVGVRSTSHLGAQSHLQAPEIVSDEVLQTAKAIHQPKIVASTLDKTGALRCDLPFVSLVQDGLSTKSKETFKLVINLFTMNRLDSFLRLWQSVDAAHPISNVVELRIHADFDPAYTTSTTLADSRALRSRHGNVVVRPHLENNGLRYNIMECWVTNDENEFGVFLEDDIEVSPFFLQYLKQSIDKYFYDPEEKKVTGDHLVGVSLYNMRWDELHEHNFDPPKDLQVVYFLQLPQSWGAAYHGPSWSRFVSWYMKMAETDPVIPDSLTNRWPKAKSWKKYMIRWMAMTGNAMIYPNLKGGYSFSTNHLEVGANNKLARKTDKDRMGSRFTVPLLTKLSQTEGITSPFDEEDGIERLVMDLPPAKELKIMNAHFEPKKSFKELPIDVTSFDSCHLLLNVINRTAIEHLPRMIEFYRPFKSLASIYLLWNLVDLPIPDEVTHMRVLPGHNTPVHILKQSRYSRNNKFMPLAGLEKDCIVSVDADWEIPEPVLDFAIQSWRGHFFSHMVGFRPQARTHLPKPNSTTAFEYIASDALPASMLRTSGVVYHKKYHGYYWHPQLKASRELVDKESDCEDILMNAIIARWRFAAPVILNWRDEDHVPALGAQSFASLDRPRVTLKPTSEQHEDEAKRSRCLTTFMTQLGGHWMRYTMSSFELGDTSSPTYFSPDINRHMMWQRGGPVSEKDKTLDIPKEVYANVQQYKKH